MKASTSLINSLKQRITLLKNTIALQSKRLSTSEAPSIHSMELAQEVRVQDETARRDELNDSDLRLDLQKQYGKTKWAKKFIDELLIKRIASRKSAL